MLSCAALAVVLAGCATPTPGPAPTFRVMTYNIHHGEGMDGRVDLERIASLILQEQADLVALQEVDRGVARTDRRDLAAELAARTGMEAVFGNNLHFQGGEYGNALLSRFPVTAWSNTHLPQIGESEQRGVLQALIEVHGRKLVLMNTHIDHRPDDTERLLAVRRFQQLARNYYPLPVILCGDFNDVPDSQVYQNLSGSFLDVWVLAGAGTGHTFSSQEPRRRIDYIWISPDNPWTPLRAWVPRSLASDHLPLVAEFSLELPQE